MHLCGLLPACWVHFIIYTPQLLQRKLYHHSCTMRRYHLIIQIFSVHQTTPPLLLGYQEDCKQISTAHLLKPLFHPMI